jgi:hypothetical protein
MFRLHRMPRVSQSNYLVQCVFDGAEPGSIVQRLSEQTTRESTDVISENQITANDELFALAA